MIKVALCQPSQNNPDKSRHLLSKQVPGNKFVWGDVIAVTEHDDPDFFICFEDDIDCTRNISPDKKIYLQREPDAVLSTKDFLVGKKFTQIFRDSFYYSIWWVDENYDELLTLPFPEKTKPINTILSYKRDTSGHRLRTDFVLDFMNKYPGQLDLFGSFAKVARTVSWARKFPTAEKTISVFNRLAGNKYPDKFNKLEIASSYRYSLVMENAQEKNFFTEKLADAYLAWTMPIYWGCPNIADFFPSDSYYLIDIANPSQAVDQLHELSQRPLTQNQISAIAEARRLILNKYNFWPALESFLVNKEYQI